MKLNPTIIKSGNIEIINFSNLGRISYNRATKIRKDYGGRPFRFPSREEIEYISEFLKLGIGGFVENYYWSNFSHWQSSVMCFNTKGYGINIEKGRASAFFVMVRDI